MEIQVMPGILVWRLQALVLLCQPKDQEQIECRRADFSTKAIETTILEGPRSSTQDIRAL
jgi:hypothetical protein